MKDIIINNCKVTECTFNNRGACTLPDAVDNTQKSIDEWLEPPTDNSSPTFAWTIEDVRWFETRIKKILERRPCIIPYKSKLEIKSSVSRKAIEMYHDKKIKEKEKGYKYSQIHSVPIESKNYTENT